MFTYGSQKKDRRPIKIVLSGALVLWRTQEPSAQNCTFLASNKNKDLFSHIIKWKAEEFFPPNHEPKMIAHMIKWLPPTTRARIQRIYLRNLSTGHFHRHIFPDENLCPFCKDNIDNLNIHTETLTHRNTSSRSEINDLTHRNTSSRSEINDLTHRDTRDQ